MYDEQCEVLDGPVDSVIDLVCIRVEVQAGVVVDRVDQVDGAYAAVPNAPTGTVVLNAAGAARKHPHD